MSILLNFIIITISCLVINYYSDLLGEYIRQIGIKLKIPVSIRGVIFDGVSSSMPEFIVSLIACISYLGLFNNSPDLKAFEDIGIGAIGGSAIFNILIIPFVSILFVSSEKIKKIKIDKKAMIRDIIVYLFAVSLLLIGSYTGELTPLLGWAMTITYIAYVLYLIKEAKTKPLEISNEVINTKKRYLILKSILVLIPIGIAIHYLIEASTIIGNELNIPRIIMSLIVLAGATSLPDALLSIKSAKNEELDASISNAVGSNSFDILICLGFIIAIANTKLKVNFEEIKYIFMFLISSSICYTIAFYFNFNKIVKIILLFVPYLVFIGYLINIA